MPKTRQQRLAERRAGRPATPPQCLEDKPRATKYTRAKTTSATEVAGPVVADTVVSGPLVVATAVAGPVVAATGVVVPATPSAVSVEPQALLRIWVVVGPGNLGQSVGGFTHEERIPSSCVPELVTFLENICDQEEDNVIKSVPKRSFNRLTSSQKMVEAIPPKKKTVKKPPKVKKRAF